MKKVYEIEFLEVKTSKKRINGTGGKTRKVWVFGGWGELQTPENNLQVESVKEKITRSGSYIYVTYKDGDMERYRLESEVLLETEEDHQTEVKVVGAYSNAGESSLGLEKKNDEQDSYLTPTQLHAEGYELTSNMSKAFYMLADGSLWEGGFEGSSRSLDHREVEAYTETDRYDGDTFWEEIFMKLGLVLVIPESMSYMRHPMKTLTSGQVKRLAQNPDWEEVLYN